MTDAVNEPDDEKPDGEEPEDVGHATEPALGDDEADESAPGAGSARTPNVRDFLPRHQLEEIQRKR